MSAKIVKDLQKNGRYVDIRRYENIILGISTACNLLLLIAGLIMPKNLANLFMNTSNITNEGISGDLRIMFTIVFIGLLFNAYRGAAPNLVKKG